MAGMHDVIVVGGGIIGLSIAREVAAHGRSVLVLERGETGEGASWAAAGMLAPQTEAEQNGPFFQLCAASHRMYRAWTDQIREQTGLDPEYVASGLLLLAPTDGDLAALRQRFAWQRTLGLTWEVLSTADTQKLEPALTMPVAGAILIPGEHQVAPRKLSSALRAACVGWKAEIRTRQRVDEILSDGRRVTGVRVGNDIVSSPYVVVASGAWTSEISGLQPQIPVSPRKGQILSLTMRGQTFTHMIQWGHSYAVPRPSGELVIGATNEDVGFDRSLTPAGIGQLLSAVQQLSTVAASYPIQEMWAGFRPATPDGLPVLGRGRLPGLVYATGHYRNGILLAPITAAAVLALIEDRPPVVPLEAFAPSRFEV